MISCENAGVKTEAASLDALRIFKEIVNEGTNPFRKYAPEPEILEYFKELYNAGFLGRLMGDGQLNTYCISTAALSLSPEDIDEMIAVRYRKILAAIPKY